MTLPRGPGDGHLNPLDVEISNCYCYPNEAYARTLDVEYIKTESRLTSPVTETRSFPGTLLDALGYTKASPPDSSASEKLPGSDSPPPLLARYYAPKRPFTESSGGGLQNHSKVNSAGRKKRRTQAEKERELAQAWLDQVESPGSSQEAPKNAEEQDARGLQVDEEQDTQVLQADEEQVAQAPQADPQAAPNLQAPPFDEVGLEPNRPQTPCFDEGEVDPEFLRAESEFKRKERAGILSSKDRSEFRMREMAEQRRKEFLQRLDQEAMEDDDEGFDGGSDELLFVSEDQGNDPDAFLFPNDDQNNCTEGFVGEEFAAQSQAKPKRKARAKPTTRQKPSRKQENDAIKIGMETGKAKKSWKNKGFTAGAIPGQSRSYTRTNLHNLDSANVFRSAAANADAPDEPTSGVDATTKREALRKLLESVPTLEQKYGKQDRKAMEQASRKLDHPRSVRARQGGWLLKGMHYPLKNYQLLGFSHMREMERATDSVRGGILADQMGLGKTVTMIANMIDGKPMPSDTLQATLVIVPATLISQWISEFEKHCQPGIFKAPVVYQGRAAKNGSLTLGLLEDQDIVITSYNEVSMSYPRFDPPVELTEEERNQWWTQRYYENRGFLHQIEWLRIVCDECTVMKNYWTHTAAAVSGLMARHRWLLTGTIVTNDILEFYSYFRFLREPMAGSFDSFKANFLLNKDARERLYQYLFKTMIRRTHDDKLAGRPILKLPPNRQDVVNVEFSKLERTIYNIVLNRCCSSIVYRLKNGLTRKLSFHVLVRLLLLRQISAHFYCAADLLVTLLYKEDMDRINSTLTNPQAHEQTSTAELARLRAFFGHINDQQRQLLQNEGEEEDGQPAPRCPQLGGHVGRSALDPMKYLNFVRESEISDQDPLEPCECCSCRGKSENCQQLTPCGHHICESCLGELRYDAARNKEDKTLCPEDDCMHEITGYLQCPEATGFLQMSQAQKNKQREESRARLMKWIKLPENVYASSKTLGVKAAILAFKKADPNVKIIVYSQFLPMIAILAQMCASENWGHAEYHGKLSRHQKDQVVENFRTLPSCNVLLASLKTGGVGLNLTEATRVILVDLYWNTAMEQQAFCRVYRIGQQQQTAFYRIVVQDSVDEMLLQMQIRKEKLIGEVTRGQQGKTEQLPIEEMLDLFGVEVRNAARSRGFVLPNSAVELMNNSGML